ncbi:MAG: hypothetical protein GEU90_03355 [Gemmatimonas sp.]|nr:hypothetical protein [Gemmatimonas sp.]
MAVLALTFAITALVHTEAGAQTTAGPGWTAWLGCWEPIPADGLPAPDGDVTSPVCVLPTGDPDAVELATIEGGQVVERDLVSADGVERPLEREGCTGVESASWSADGTRLYQRSEFACTSELTRGSSGIFAILGNGEWATVHAVSVGSYTDVRVLRYRPISDLESVSAEAALALEGRAMALDAARTAAGAPPEFSDVVEATTRVNDAAIEGWLIEHGQGFPLNAGRLVMLADAGVSDRVIDVIVALSYPTVFAIDRSAREGRERTVDRPPLSRPAGPVAVLDPFYGGYYPGRYRGGYYGGSYYGGGYGGGWYGAPVIVPREQSQDDDNGGRLVKGRGYSRGRGSDDSAGPASRPSASPSGSRGSSGSASGAGRSSGGSSGGSTGRVAKPRSND